jgi:hypothetical protein
LATKVIDAPASTSAATRVLVVLANMTVSVGCNGGVIPSSDRTIARFAAAVCDAVHPPNFLFETDP